jgi:DNA-directed RNA polymerase subunit beta'
VKGGGKVFSDEKEVIAAYNAEELDLQAVIMVRIDKVLTETTTGRILLGEVLPTGLPFELVNRLMDKKSLSELIFQAFFAGRAREDSDIAR